MASPNGAPLHLLEICFLFVTFAASREIEFTSHCMELVQPGPCSPNRRESREEAKEAKHGRETLARNWATKR